MREAIARCCSLLREQGQSHCTKQDGALVGLKLERGGCSALVMGDLSSAHASESRAYALRYSFSHLSLKCSH